MQPQVLQMQEAVRLQLQMPLRVLLNRNTQGVANKMSQAELAPPFFIKHEKI